MLKGIATRESSISTFVMGVVLLLTLYAHDVPIQMWDESRLAVNATEMAQTGQLITTTFEYKAETWNLKPPLMIWCQAAAIHFFGISHFAVRLPSLLAAVATLCVLYAFCSWHFKDGRRIGLWAAFILITTPGYNGLHVARTGDYDTILVFWSLVYVLAFYNWLIGLGGHYFLLGCIALALAIMTKGIAGIFCLPVLVLIWLILRFRRQQPANNWVWMLLGLTALMLIVGGYYAWREFEQPGYLQLVVDNELWGRYSHVIEGHVGPPWFYVAGLLKHRMPLWSYLGLLLLLFGVYRQYKMLTKFSLIWYVLFGQIFFLIALLSFSATKLAWYDAVLFPFFAIAIAAYGHVCLQFVGDRLRTVLVVCFGVMAVYPIVEENWGSYSESWHQQRYGLLIDEALDKYPDAKSIIAVCDEYNASLLFYKYQYEQSGLSIKITNSNSYKRNSSVEKTHIVITTHPGTQRVLSDSLNLALLTSSNNGYIFKP